ncbi:hypothetical protein L6452_35398 [Arctium lappa]|uniref:Uncharacterized protein n=1 Tax=Arctium lappa TaxID=4217 RepID=A0ACB8Y6B5_ARCLA|nr:hypothetical protein L6452_35398 [Arctium lappa]
MDPSLFHSANPNYNCSPSILCIVSYPAFYGEIETSVVEENRKLRTHNLSIDVSQTGIIMHVNETFFLNSGSSNLL